MALRFPLLSCGRGSHRSTGTLAVTGALIDCGLFKGGSGRCRQQSHVCYGKSKPRNRWKPSNVEFRGAGRPKPSPPTVEEYLAPPMPGTEEILRAACKNMVIPEDLHLKPKESAVPWILELDFQSDEEAWKFIDSLPDDEVWRQKRKYGLLYGQTIENQKRIVMKFVREQRQYRKEAHELMIRRLHKANKRAERRAVLKLRRPEIKAARRKMAMEAKPRKYRGKLSDDFFQPGDGDWYSPIWQEENKVDGIQVMISDDLPDEVLEPGESEGQEQ